LAELLFLLVVSQSQSVPFPWDLSISYAKSGFIQRNQIFLFTEIDLDSFFLFSDIVYLEKNMTDLTCSPYMSISTQDLCITVDLSIRVLPENFLNTHGSSPAA